MDILTSHGELSAQDLSELSVLSKDELVALVIALNKGWYQLLENLEDAHRQDLKQLEARLTAQLSDSLNATRTTESAQIAGLRSQFEKSGKELASQQEGLKENERRLAALKTMLGELTNTRAVGR